MSPLLDAYLALERTMLTLERNGDDAAADVARDAMDPLWLGLSDSDRAFLDQRTATGAVGASTLVAGQTLVSGSGPARAAFVVSDWRIAA